MGGGEPAIRQSKTGGCALRFNGRGVSTNGRRRLTPDRFNGSFFLPLGGEETRHPIGEGYPILIAPAPGAVAQLGSRWVVRWNVSTHTRCRVTVPTAPAPPLVARLAAVSPARGIGYVSQHPSMTKTRGAEDEDNRRSRSRRSGCNALLKAD